MKTHTCAQRSETWFALRLGKLTGSSAADMLATIKKGESAARRNLRVRLALERLTGTSQESGFISADMERGTALEPEAIAAYELQTSAMVVPVGFMEHDDLAAGCSPDGLVDADGLVEVKCPRSANHYDYLKGEIPDEYWKQITHNLWISGRAWADFVSYDPRFPEPLRLSIHRVKLLAAERDAYELLVRQFLREVDAEVEAMRALCTPLVAVA